MYLIKYDNVTNKYKDEFGWHETEYKILYDRRGFYIEDILYYSPNKEKVEEYKDIYNNSKKYNI